MVIARAVEMRRISWCGSISRTLARFLKLICWVKPIGVTCVTYISIQYKVMICQVKQAAFPATCCHCRRPLSRGFWSWHFISLSEVFPRWRATHLSLLAARAWELSRGQRKRSPWAVTVRFVAATTHRILDSRAHQTAITGRRRVLARLLGCRWTKSVRCGASALTTHPFPAHVAVA